MHSEETYIDMIESMWPLDERCSDALLALAFESCKEHPESSILHCFAGDLLQLHAEIGTCDPARLDSLYSRAIALDPENADAWTSLGFVHDVYRDDFERAIDCFRQAVELGGNAECYDGLARCFAQSGRKQEALDTLEPDACPFAFEESIVTLRHEIETGMWDAIEEFEDDG